MLSFSFLPDETQATTAIITATATITAPIIIAFFFFELLFSGALFSPLSLVKFLFSSLIFFTPYVSIFEKILK